MPHVAKVLFIGIIIVFVAQLLWRRWRTAQQAAKRKLATLEFEGLREGLQSEFLQAAAATGKPRGLRWKNCELHNGVLFATDRANDDLYALVATTVSFEAIEGGGMEDVEAVGNLRAATAIFIHRGGQWTTDGRVVFNLEPQQALEHYQESLQSLD
ncbi:MAG: hypothetical protein AAGD11_08125 [Planctomycetota bacterium]